jgi:methyltransferase (TIGR00027 family)
MTLDAEPPLDPVAGTARWTAAARARENARSDRLFEDPLAAALAGEEGMARLEAEPPESRDNPILAIRTRVFDDWLLESTASGPRQVVLLAAGMDARAFRLSWPAGVRLWEVDRPELLKLKAEILEREGAAPRVARTPVAADLDGGVWLEQLQAAGFRVDEPSVWLAEGFFVYLEERAVESILGQAATLAGPGSQLLTDFVSVDFMRSGWMQQYLRRLEQRKTPWLFATNRPEDLLEAHGWRATVVRQPGEEGASFGRWFWGVAPRDQPGWPRTFFVRALIDRRGPVDQRASSTGQ